MVFFLLSTLILIMSKVLDFVNCCLLLKTERKQSISVQEVQTLIWNCLCQLAPTPEWFCGELKLLFCLIFWIVDGWEIVGLRVDGIYAVYGVWMNKWNWFVEEIVTACVITTVRLKVLMHHLQANSTHWFFFRNLFAMGMSFSNARLLTELGIFCKDVNHESMSIFRYFQVLTRERLEDDSDKDQKP
jgi:hypothetical protein